MEKTAKQATARASTAKAAIQYAQKPVVTRTKAGNVTVVPKVPEEVDAALKAIYGINNKRASAQAFANEVAAIAGSNIKNPDVLAVSSVAVLVGGIGHCQTTGEELKKEVRPCKKFGQKYDGKFGLTGYANPGKSWWGSHTRSGQIAATMGKDVRVVLRHYAKADALTGDVTAKLAQMFNALYAHLPADVGAKKS